MNANPETCPRVALTAGFQLPAHDLGDFLGRLGSKLFKHERRMSQYVYWSVSMGLFELMAEAGSVTLADVSERTPLNESGADALLGILAALGLATRDCIGRYRLTGLSREYFLRDSPFYIGGSLDSSEPLPHHTYLSAPPSFRNRMRFRILKLMPSLRYGSAPRIANQHTRNLASCAAAVRTGEFTGVRCLVDIAGGSGTFSIPLALEYPDMRVILTDVPAAVKNVKPLLVQHGLEDRVELLGLDAFLYPWTIPADCDGIFIGNFLHGFGDETCNRVCRESFERLQTGGRVWLHELLWNDNKNGPLITAMWNAAMRGGGPGRQRTAPELLQMLQNAGFRDLKVVPTAGSFSLVCGRKS